MRHQRLSVDMRGTLLLHIDGRLPLSPIGHPNHRRVLSALADRGLIWFEPGASCPRWTAITTKGRQVLSDLLADAADMLVQAGLGEEPVEKVRRSHLLARIRCPSVADEQQVGAL